MASWLFAILVWLNEILDAQFPQISAHFYECSVGYNEPSN